jgi:hypothetical protein
MLSYPQNQDWFTANLGEYGMYTITNEHPNKYRKRGIDTISNPTENYEPVVRIERGLYKGGTDRICTD